MKHKILVENIWAHLKERFVNGCFFKYFNKYAIGQTNNPAIFEEPFLKSIIKKP